MGRTENTAARVHAERDQLEAKYNQYKALVDELSQHFQRAKHGLPICRYRQLKDMIKTCYDHFQRMEQESSGAATESVGMLAGSRDLAEKVQQLRDRSMLAARYKLENSKKEVQALTVNMEMEASDYQEKILHIKQLIEAMYENYEASKSQSPRQRYNTMKNIAKSVFNDPNI
ncbi:uncharacterized protein LOC106176912 [Lingula anatina]|uniref:Uncharacterized protein LOC106176912 n=1 Tax=Lingula anatina TaxID=7574 RepID=A0A1S3JY26_LINAN|nr:uncharacterized protein LOC106176912 [Lingula anatina]|eukprot:XP_013414954.1 uncharacterized protein LOC106176912 [Lingula anatina]